MSNFRESRFASIVAAIAASAAMILALVVVGDILSGQISAATKVQQRIAVDQAIVACIFIDAPEPHPLPLKVRLDLRRLAHELAAEGVRCGE